MCGQSGGIRFLAKFLLMVVLGGAWLLSGGGHGAVVWAAEEGAARPNFIVVMTDDQGYGPIGAHGHPWIRTPHLDRLHSQSLRLTRFMVSPTCSPTRSALMTGRQPLRNGVSHTHSERERLTLAATTLPEVLRTVGYTSGIFGKWHLGDAEEYQPHRRGFDEAFIHGCGGIGQAYDCSCADAPDNSYFDPVIRHNGSFVKTEGYCTDLFFNAALGWIKKQHESNQPFFAYIATNAPHAPFLAPNENEKRFTDRGFNRDQAGFYGMIENIDDNMGRLLEKYENWGLAKNTVLIFLSDNGMVGGAPGRPDVVMGHTEAGEPMLPYNAGMKGLKGSVDEGGVRVPFFVRWDGHVRAGCDAPQLTAHLDLLPTLAELAGAEIPTEQVEGRSLLPIWRDPDAPWADRLLVTHFGRWEQGANPDDHQWNRFSLRTARYRLVNNTALFDMLTDPGQQHNIIQDHPELVARLREEYDAWWKITRPLLVNEEAEFLDHRPFHVLYEQQQKSTGIPTWNPPEL